MTRRAPGVCNVPGCIEPPVPGRGGCPRHAPPPWHDGGEGRRGNLPPPAAYRRLRRHIRRRARHRCEQCGAPVPNGTGQVDHRRPLAAGGPTTPDNLWLLCDTCAARKTRADLAQLRHDRDTLRHTPR